MEGEGDKVDEGDRLLMGVCNGEDEALGLGEGEGSEGGGFGKVMSSDKSDAQGSGKGVALSEMLG